MDIASALGRHFLADVMAALVVVSERTAG